jgi:hypothetical protein
MNTLPATIPFTSQTQTVEGKLSGADRRMNAACEIGHECIFEDSFSSTIVDRDCLIVKRTQSFARHKRQMDTLSSTGTCNCYCEEC